MKHYSILLTLSLLAAASLNAQSIRGQRLTAFATYADDTAANAACTHTAGSCPIGVMYRRSSDSVLRIVCSVAGTFTDVTACIGGSLVATSVTSATFASPATNTDLTLTPNGTGNVLLSSGLLKFHGTTSSFPALKRSTTSIQVKLADDSGFANLSAAGYESNTGGIGFAVGSSTGNIRFWSGASYDTSLYRGSAANSLAWGGQTSSFPAIKRSTTSLQVRLADDSAFGGFQSGTYATGVDCASAASPAVCTSAAAGSVVIAAAATTVTVNTTAVTANSQIFVQFDSSLGTKLSVTCNTTYAAPFVTARTAATSFAFDVAAAPTTNPACYSYWIVN